MKSVMKTIEEQKEFWSMLMDMLEAQFGPKCEIVLHDLTKDYNHTIIDIRNGHLTHRQIGGSGTNLGLEILSGNVQGNGNKFNYIVHTRLGKIFRSSSLYIRDDDGKVIGSLCINLDITDSLKFEEFLKEYNNYPVGTPNNEESEEVFAGNVTQLLDYLIQEGINRIGKKPQDMNRTDKINFIRFLDEKGAFLISKSAEHVCQFLSISKYTIYNYLEMARNRQEYEKQKEELLE